jgi:hypothetical protein
VAPERQLIPKINFTRHFSIKTVFKTRKTWFEDLLLLEVPLINITLLKKEKHIEDKLIVP